MVCVSSNSAMTDWGAFNSLSLSIVEVLYVSWRPADPAAEAPVPNIVMRPASPMPLNEHAKIKKPIATRQPESLKTLVGTISLLHFSQFIFPSSLSRLSKMKIAEPWRGCQGIFFVDSLNQRRALCLWRFVRLNASHPLSVNPAERTCRFAPNSLCILGFSCRCMLRVTSAGLFPAKPAFSLCRHDLAILRLFKKQELRIHAGFRPVGFSGNLKTRRHTF